MRVLSVFVEDPDNDKLYAQLKMFLFNNRTLRYEETDTQATTKSRDGSNKPWLMPFGKKYKGKTIEQIDSQYLQWSLETYVANKKKQDKGDKRVFILSDEIRDIFSAELDKRKAQNPLQAAQSTK